MPEKSILRFDLAWKSRLSLAIGFHADFLKPKAEKGGKEDVAKGERNRFVPGDSTILPHLFGNSYVLQIFSTHLMLLRTSIDPEGQPKVERIQINGNGMRLGETGKATVEVRCDRSAGLISLFLNGEFIAQWREEGEAKAETYAGKGGGFGFAVQAEDSAVRISDVMVAEWNGMPDAARSLEIQDQAVVLLTNGTDRIAGDVQSLENGQIVLRGKYGEFRFDLADIAEIRFGRSQLAEKLQRPAGTLGIKLGPIGLISGIPLSGDSGSIRLSNPIYGQIDVSLDSAIMLDFKLTNNATDDWDLSF